MASKCSSFTLAFFFTILFMVASVHHVVALRELHSEIQILEQVILPNLGKKGCGHRCKTNDGCKPLRFCVSCEYIEKLGRLGCLPKSEVM
ncbi:hypothetical protein P3L10_031871 [Capsicum annuum]